MTGYAIDSPEKWAEAVWRIGRSALKLHLEGRIRFSAEEAVRLGLVDGTPQERDGNRSALASRVAAELVRSGGGDALERAEFALLFAAGEPQKGLRAFLEKRNPSF
jgi:enoyl-CoA hydratase/carnithine racemase